MGVNKIEHLGIAVKDLDSAERLFEQLLGSKSYKREEVASENVITSFFKCGDSKVELLQATSPESAIAKFIEKKGEGMHHVAFDVEHIEGEIDRLKGEGFQFINEQPKDGADNKRIVFLHPKSSGGVLVELCEEKK